MGACPIPAPFHLWRGRFCSARRPATAVGKRLPRSLKLMLGGYRVQLLLYEEHLTGHPGSGRSPSWDMVLAFPQGSNHWCIQEVRSTPLSP